MPIDGKNATKAEMQALKKVCAAIIKTYKVKQGQDFSWSDLFNEKIGLGVSETYEANLQKGIAGQQSVFKIYRWIIAHELDLACKVAPALFSPSDRTSWQRLLAAH